MQMLAAFLPPTSVIDEVLGALDAADQLVAEPTAVTVSRTWLGRRRGPSRPPSAPEAPTRVLEAADSTLPTIPIARFGNVTPGDAARVAAALVTTAREWPPAEIHVSGLRVGGPGDDRLVVAELGGDLAALAAIAASVSRCAASLRFYLDRRLFKPELEVARLVEHVTATQRESVTAAIAGFHSQSWAVDHVVLLQHVFDSTGPGMREIHRIGVGGSSEHGDRP